MGSQVMRWTFNGRAAPSKFGKGDSGRGEDGEFAILQEVDVAGVVEDAGDVGGEEEFALADADDGGRTHAGGDELVGLVGGEDADGEGSGEAVDGAADGFFEDDAGGLLDLFFDQVGDDLGVGLGDELVAGGGKLFFESEIVLNDAVVDDDEGAGAVAVGVRVFFGRAAVGGPAGVADAEAAVQRMLGDDGFEVAQLAGSTAEFETVGIARYGDAGGVISAVFETAQAFNDDGDDGLRSDVTNNSTHRFSLDGGGKFCAAGGVRLLWEIRRSYTVEG